MMMTKYYYFTTKNTCTIIKEQLHVQYMYIITKNQGRKRTHALLLQSRQSTTIVHFHCTSLFGSGPTQPKISVKYCSKLHADFYPLHYDRILLVPTKGKLFYHPPLKSKKLQDPTYTVH